MHGWFRSTAVALTVGAVVFAVTSASATTAVPQSSGGLAATAAAPPIYQPVHQAQYVPITPCRIVDSRGGSGSYGVPIGSLAYLSYYVGGTAGFPAQGGKSGGCGIPVGAVSIAASLTAVSPQHAGYLRAWPQGQAEPTATVLNYSTVNIGTGTTLAINSGSAFALRVRNYGGPTELVIDVTGYYVKPLAGMISPTGSPYSGSSRILSATHPNTGVYEVRFDRNIKYCSATATAYTPSFTGYYATANTWFDVTRPDTVRVIVWTTAAVAVDQYFYITVTC